MRRLRRILIELARSERGLALPLALMVTVVGMGLAAVPIVASVNSQGGNQHNQGGNEALAAAEAGAEIALQRQGDLHLKEKLAQLCVSEPASVTGSQGPSPGWCRTEPFNIDSGQVEPGSVGLATYTYQVLPCYGVGAAYQSCGTVAEEAECEGLDPIEVVSTGKALVASLWVERRVSVTGCALSYDIPATDYTPQIEEHTHKVETLEGELRVLKEPGTTLTTEITKLEKHRSELEGQIAKETAEGKKRFESKTRTEEKTVEREVAPNVFGAGGQIFGIEGLNMSNNAQIYSGGAGTNKALTMVGSANVCGTVRFGKEYGKTVNNGSEGVPSYCKTGRTFIEAKKTEELKFPEVALPAEIATKNSNTRLGGLDPASGYARGNVSWNESKKELSLTYGELTLEGTLPYYLCKLVLGGGGTLKAGAGKSIRIFFAEPTAKNCPGLNGAAQLQIANGTSVMADSNHGPGFYFVGSSPTAPSNEQSKVELGGGSNVSQFIVYAPRSAVTANNGVNVSGAIIGRTLELAGGAKINEKGAYTPPASTEFVAPEKKTEIVIVQLPPEEKETTLGTNEDELGTVIGEIQTKETKLKSINTEPITHKEGELSVALGELAEWQAKANGSEGSEGSTSFQKSGFAECTATGFRPKAPGEESAEPAEGC
jgi:hypothetical protein